MTIETVLLVDDEPDIRMIGAMCLKGVGGWQVIEAENGSDAVALAIQHGPDVILLDVMMPGMDGPTTLHKLREHSSLANTPIVFMTAKVQKSEVARYLSLGAAGVIHKPFDPMTLSSQVQRLIS